MTSNDHHIDTLLSKEQTITVLQKKERNTHYIQGNMYLNHGMGSAILDEPTEEKCRETTMLVHMFRSNIGLQLERAILCLGF